MHMISQNAQVILVVDHTMLGNDGTEIIHDMAAKTTTDGSGSESLWEEVSQGCKLPWATSTQTHPVV